MPKINKVIVADMEKEIRRFRRIAKKFLDDENDSLGVIEDSELVHALYHLKRIDCSPMATHVQ